MADAMVVMGVVYVVMAVVFFVCTAKSEGAANEQALIHAEDEIRALEVLLEEEKRVAPHNNNTDTVQPSSQAALQNAKRAMVALKHMNNTFPFSYYCGSTNRRTDLCEKVTILGSHKAYYKAARRQRAVPGAAANVSNHLVPVKSLPVDDNDDGSADAVATVALLSPAPAADFITSLTDLDSEIRDLMQLQWYSNTEAAKKRLKQKKAEFDTAIKDLDETQRMEWLLFLA
jgi:hypothetical protein